MASFSEFVVDGHYCTSPNQQNQPPTVSFSDSEPLPDNISPSQLRNHVWAHHHSPYLPFVLKSPFNGPMTSRFATPPEDTPFEKDKHGYHLPVNVAKSWKTLEQSCRQVATVLRSAFEWDCRCFYRFQILMETSTPKCSLSSSTCILKTLLSAININIHWHSSPPPYQRYINP